MTPIQKLRLLLIWASALCLGFYAVFVLCPSAAAARASAPAAHPAPFKPLPSFIAGADLSYLLREEQLGAVYKDQGKAENPLVIFKKDGFNLVRLRIWVHPRQSGQPITWMNVNDLHYTLALAKMVKAAGFRLLLDFHYSDTWADPGHQTKPASWDSLSFPQLKTKIQSYSRHVITVLRQGGAMPDIVEVGNETNNGILWPDGKVENPNGWNNYGQLVKAAIAGVRQGAGPAPMPKIMIHIANGADTSMVQWFFDNLTKQDVPFDFIGLSYYPEYGVDMAHLQQSLAMIAQRYHKPVIIAETAYPSSGSPAANQTVFEKYGMTPEGQLHYLQALVSLVKAMPDGLGRGVIYWQPEWVPIKGLDQHNGTKEMFDMNFNALPGMKAFQK